MKRIDKLYTEKSVCANERIPRRARKSAFLGIRSFCILLKVPDLPGALKRRCPAISKNSQWELYYHVLQF